MGKENRIESTAESRLEIAVVQNKTVARKVGRGVGILNVFEG